jgi:hypothetical protein
MKTITRRRFVVLTGLGAVGLATTPMFFKRAADSGFEAILRRKMGPLQIPDQVMDRFLADFMKEIQGSHWGKKYRMTGSNAVLVQWFGVDRYVLQDPGMVHPIEKLVTQFVMSTNLSTDPAVAEGRHEVKYLGIWSHDNACANPFADFSFR